MHALIEMIMVEGNCPGENMSYSKPGGICPGGNLSGVIVSGGKCPGGNCSFPGFEPRIGSPAR